MSKRSVPFEKLWQVKNQGSGSSQQVTSGEWTPGDTEIRFANILRITTQPCCWPGFISQPKVKRSPWAAVASVPGLNPPTNLPHLPTWTPSHRQENWYLLPPPDLPGQASLMPISKAGVW